MRLIACVARAAASSGQKVRPSNTKRQWHRQIAYTVQAMIVWPSTRSPESTGIGVDERNFRDSYVSLAAGLKSFF
ncbi:hypothetical protein G6F70_009220 [Rhizopus microsporus]|nr:hypothetical protein G6F70_009220 [Rhizopus microsporus]